MKKIGLLFMLALTASASFADVGLFFDGTKKYGNTGVIQAQYPNMLLLNCPSYKKCSKNGNNERVYDFVKFFVYEDAKNIKAELKTTEDQITMKGVIANAEGKGFNVTLNEGIGEGGYYGLIGLKQKGKAKAKLPKAKQIEIAQAIRDVMIKAIERVDSGAIVDGFNISESSLVFAKISRQYPQANQFGNAYRYSPTSSVVSYTDVQYIYAYVYENTEDTSRKIGVVGTFDANGNFLSPLELQPEQFLSNPEFSFLRDNIISNYPAAFYVYKDYVNSQNSSYRQVHDQCNNFLGVFDASGTLISTTPIVATEPAKC